MAIYSFGSGLLYAIRTDIANATPIMFGTLSDVSVEFSGSNKELYGQYQFPVAVARGKSKIACKAKFGQISGSLFSSLFFGVTPAAGQVASSSNEAQAVAAATPYTVTAANAATFLADLGVTYQASGLPLTKVSAAPAAGQYSVSDAGVYTFFSGDAEAAVYLNYTYSVAATGQQIVVPNQQMGIQPVFAAKLVTSYTAPGGLKKAVLNLNACVSSKLSLATKQDDFAIPEMDFDAFADAAGNVFSWSFNEVS